MNLDLLTFFIFVIIISIFLYLKRKNVEVQKLLFPVFYLVLYRTKFGINLMDKAAKRFKEHLKLIGYICTGLSFIGLFYVSYSVLLVMIKFFIAPKTTDTGFSLVLPGTSVPGVGYLSFWFWIIPIVILAIVHEFSHGVIARAHGIKVKSSGFAFLGVFAPIIPAAFVEPDEKELEKKEDIVQYSVFAAGPLANIFFAIILLMIFPYVGDLSNNHLAPFEDTITYPAGFSVDILNESLPSTKAGMSGHLLITKYNNEPVYDANSFIQGMSCVRPGEIVNLGSEEKNFKITTIKHPDNPEKAYVGVNNIKNERRVKPEYNLIKGPYYWVKDLIKWLFLLNYFIGMVNLFPIFITDGARILKVAALKLFKNKQTALRVWGFINLLFLLFLIVGTLATYLKKMGAF